MGMLDNNGEKTVVVPNEPAAVAVPNSKLLGPFFPGKNIRIPDILLYKNFFFSCFIRDYIWLCVQPMSLWLWLMGWGGGCGYLSCFLVYFY